jgi:hypothetical protein
MDYSTWNVEVVHTWDGCDEHCWAARGELPYSDGRRFKRFRLLRLTSKYTLKVRGYEWDADGTLHFEDFEEEPDVKYELQSFEPGPLPGEGAWKTTEAEDQWDWWWHRFTEFRALANRLNQRDASPMFPVLLQDLADCPRGRDPVIHDTGKYLWVWHWGFYMDRGGEWTKAHHYRWACYRREQDHYVGEYLTEINAPPDDKKSRQDQDLCQAFLAYLAWLMEREGITQKEA